LQLIANPHASEQASANGAGRVKQRLESRVLALSYRRDVAFQFALALLLVIVTVKAPVSPRVG